MEIPYILYILFSLPILYHDIRYQIIPDRYSLPAVIFVMIALFVSAQPLTPSLIAAGSILLIFLIPLFFNMPFGGGDLRYGVLSALIVGFPDIAYWLILAPLIHLLILLIVREEIFGFAPAMFMATLLLPFLLPYVS